MVTPNIQDLNAHLTIFFEHISKSEPMFAEQYKLWRRKNPDGHQDENTDIHSYMYLTLGGQLFERSLTGRNTALLPPGTLAAVREYYRQDMVCLRDLNYTWDHIETPHWHENEASAVPPYR